MSAAKICGNSSSQSAYGGGVFVDYNSTFTMSNGEISGNEADYGGGVYVSGSGATFEMSSGEISGNSADYDGGVFVSGSGATFEMSDGEISNNTANYGGGVFVENNGTFTKTSGIIHGSDNASLKNTTISGDAYGHAVYVVNGTKRRNSTAGTGVIWTAERATTGNKA